MHRQVLKHIGAQCLFSGAKKNKILYKIINIRGKGELFTRCAYSLRLIENIHYTLSAVVVINIC